MKLSSSIVLRLLGVLLLAAGALKGWQLLTEPMANNDIWSYRPFLILQVEFELAMGLWLLSGLLPKAAWLASLGCFCLFCLVTLYKGLSGAASCGCFGPVHVNPWITLMAIDLPAVAALTIFRPVLSLAGLRAFLRPRDAVRALWREFMTPRPSFPHLAAAVLLGVAVPGATTPILALSEPPASTTKYEVLEPKTWTGAELPILGYIDVAEQLKSGTWLLLLYHHGCPGCAKAVPAYEQMARDLAGNEDFLRIALIEVPPYGPAPAGEDSPCLRGRLAQTKEWFVATPAVAVTTDGVVQAAWEQTAPDLEAVMTEMAQLEPKTAISPDFISRSIQFTTKGGTAMAIALDDL